MKIVTGIASTTHMDRHNERMSQLDLGGMARNINDKYIPFLIDHDWDRCIGIVLYGKVFRLNDGEYALGVVVGIYENDEEKGDFQVGKKNKTWSNFKDYLKQEESKFPVKSKTVNGSRDKHKNSESFNVADLLKVHLDSTQVLSGGVVYKIKKFIASTGDLRIEIYPNDHFPPHFHVISKQRKMNARFSLDTLELINTKAGKIRESDVKKVQNFFFLYPNLLNKLKEEYEKFNQKY